MKNLTLILIFGSILFAISMCTRKMIYDEPSQKYIEKILIEDNTVKRTYGSVKSFKLYRKGRYGNIQLEDGYDYYFLDIKGSKSSGEVEIRLYKDKFKKIKNYKIEIYPNNFLTDLVSL